VGKSKLTEAVEGTEGIIKARGSSLATANKGEQFSSFDVDAFEVPGGRDEIWRFTPLKRLHGLHDGSAVATGVASITVAEQPGVTVETARRGDERLGQGGARGPCCRAGVFIVQRGNGGDRWP